MDVADTAICNVVMKTGAAPQLQILARKLHERDKCGEMKKTHVKMEDKRKRSKKRAMV